MFSDAKYVPKFSIMEVATHVVQEKSLVSWDTVLDVLVPGRWWLLNSLNYVTCNKIASLVCNSFICESKTAHRVHETKANDIY